MSYAFFIYFQHGWMVRFGFTGTGQVSRRWEKEWRLTVSSLFYPCIRLTKYLECYYARQYCHWQWSTEANRPWTKNTRHFNKCHEDKSHEVWLRVPLRPQRALLTRWHISSDTGTELKEKFPGVNRILASAKAPRFNLLKERQDLKRELGVMVEGNPNSPLIVFNDSGIILHY